MFFKRVNGKCQLLIMLASAAILLSSCDSDEQSRRELAEDCARLMFPYGTFTTLYHDLRVEGESASRKHYEKMIYIQTEELYREFSVAELKKIHAFYKSQLGQRLLRVGLGSKSWQALCTQEETVPKTAWTCTMHPEILKPKAGLCPICRRELIPVFLDKNSTVVN